MSFRLFIFAFSLIALGIGHAFAQMSPATKRNLQRQIQDSRAVVVNPTVIQAATVVSSGGDTTNNVEATPVAAEPGPSSAPQGEPAPMSAAAAARSSVTPIGNAVVIHDLDRGKLAYVELAPTQEQAAQMLLGERLAADAPVKLGSLHSFQGAVRQLSSDNQELQLKSYVLVGQPLQYVKETGRFVGTILVGVADLFSEAGPRTLSVPLHFEVLESALADPQRVALKETSPPYERILVTSRVEGQPVTIHIASNFSREGVEVSVPVEPTLIVNIDGGNLRAFGMQTTRITVTAVGGNGAGGIPVQLSAPGAFLPDSDVLKFDDSGVARATLRSDSPGEIEVTARAAGYAPGAQSVKVIWPWPTLFATCLGGLIGGFVRLGARIRKGIKLGPFIVGLVISVFVGAIVFALYVVGVKLLPVSFSVEVGDIFAFAASALAGWLGSGVLPALQPKAI